MLRLGRYPPKKIQSSHLNDDKDDVVDDNDEGEYESVDSDNFVVCFIATL